MLNKTSVSNSTFIDKEPVETLTKGVEVNPSDTIDALNSCDNQLTNETSPVPRLNSILKKSTSHKRKKCSYDSVTVYYFARRQGWCGVPKEGGNTLGKVSLCY